jgi:hypothetical protein
VDVVVLGKVLGVLILAPIRELLHQGLNQRFLLLRDDPRSATTVWLPLYRIGLTERSLEPLDRRLTHAELLRELDGAGLGLLPRLDDAPTQVF